MKNKISLIVFGVVLAFILLELCLQVAGFVYRKRQELANQKALSREGTYRILCIGESTTQGQYPAHLEQILNEKNIGVRFSVIDKGQVNATTDYLIAVLEDNIKLYSPHMIVAMMGENDRRKNVVYEMVPSEGVFHKSKAYRLMLLVGVHFAACFSRESKAAMVVAPKVNALTEERPHKRSKDDIDFITSAQYYNKNGWYAKAVQVSLQGLAKEPQNEWLSIQLGIGLIGQRKFKEAEAVCLKVLKVKPNNNYVHKVLGQAYAGQGKNVEAEEVLEKVIQGDVFAGDAFNKLGDIYRSTNRHVAAVPMYKKALEIMPNDMDCQIDMMHALTNVGKYDEAARSFGKLAELTYQLTLKGKQGWSQGFFDTIIQKRNDVRPLYFNTTLSESNGFNEATIYNFKKLKNITKECHVQLVCMQYPMRKVTPLKSILEPPEGIVFVDNERGFQEAVARDGYEEYFIDKFGGDFGHCTTKGNRLIAQNLADTIVQALFNQDSITH